MRWSKKRSISGKSYPRKKEDDVKRRSDRAKVLTNDGELSKAFATMVERGVAASTEKTIAQLTTKFPKRKRSVRWPDKDRIDELRRIVEGIVVEMDVDRDDRKQEPNTVKSECFRSESLKELHESIENDFQAVQVQ